MKDKYYLTYILFYAFGLLTQVSVNFFVTATDYWMYKFRDPANETYNHANRTGLQASFTSYYGIVAATSNFLALAFSTFFLMRVSILKRIFGNLCGMIVMFAFTLIFVQINTDSWQVAFFVITLTIGFFLTAFGTTFMLTLFELITKFPPNYLSAILSGQALSGVFSALIQIIALSIGAGSKTTGLIYFLIGTFFIFSTLVSYLAMLIKSKFFRVNIRKLVQTEKPQFTKEVFLVVLKKVKFYMFALFVILGSTVMVHPAVTSLVVSVDKGSGNQWHDIYFVPVITFLIYNISDYVGRELASKINWPKNDIAILVVSLIRVALVPLLILCNAHPRKNLPVVFDVDYAYIIFIIAFALTHGYINILCAVQVRTLMTTDDELKIAMYFLLIFMMISGMACSYISIAILAAL